ncbi:MAG: hypothetical protein K1V97_07470, partial [Lachnospiraceae bacterium]
MKNILVLFGGVSSEHDVSCVSAASVIANIPRAVSYTNIRAHETRRQDVCRVRL